MGRTGSSTSHEVYLIDFGLAHQYRFVSDFLLLTLIRDEDGKHMPFQENVPFRGTHRYASISSHFRIGTMLCCTRLTSLEQTRRDDMEALGYVLIYFLKGKGT